MGATKHDCEGATQLASGDDAEFLERLNTFDNWTGRIDKTELARAGFSYSGSGDKVVCPSCGLKLLNWTSTDNPLHEHAKRRQLCPFINSAYRQLRLNKPPKHPQYQELQARLDSFVGWPGRFVPKTPEELSAAGFFYIGSADRVTCFQCGITLRDWEEEHDPVQEHRRYSEHCQFINNTNLNQLGVNTRNSNVASGQTACANVTDDSIPNTEQATENRHRDQVRTSTEEGDENKQELRQTAEQCSNVNSQTSEKAIEPSVITGKQTEMTQASFDETKPEDGDESKKTSSPKSKSRVAGTSNVTKLLKEENQRLKSRRTCKVCKNATVGILFLPCGHLVTCSDCAPEVVDCVTCGKTILGTVRTYFT